MEFDRSVKVDFRGVNVTSDAGLLAFRERNEVLGLAGMAAGFLLHTRTGLNTRHGLVAQLRQSVYSRGVTIHVERKIQAPRHEHPGDEPGGEAVPRLQRVTGKEDAQFVHPARLAWDK